MPESSKSPAESAQFLLTIFLKLRAADGEPIPRSTLATNFAHPPWNASRLDLGIEFAVDHGWVAHAGPDKLALTVSGLDAALTR